MNREYVVVGKLKGLRAQPLLRALQVGVPIEFEQRGDEVIIKAVTRVVPDCLVFPQQQSPQKKKQLNRRG